MHLSASPLRHVLTTTDIVDQKKQSFLYCTHIISMVLLHASVFTLLGILYHAKTGASSPLVSIEHHRLIRRPS